MGKLRSTLDRRIGFSRAAIYACMLLVGCTDGLPEKGLRGVVTSKRVDDSPSASSNDASRGTRTTEGNTAASEGSTPPLSAPAERTGKPSLSTFIRNNSASYLVEHAANIHAVEVVRIDTGEHLGMMEASELEALCAQLKKSKPTTSISAAGPMWDVLVLLYFTDAKRPLAAIPVGFTMLRVNARNPRSMEHSQPDGSRDPLVLEVAVDQATYKAFARIVGDRVPLNKEYRLPGDSPLPEWLRDPD